MKKISFKAISKNALRAVALLAVCIPMQTWAQKNLTLKDCVDTFDERRVEPNATGWAYWFIPAGGVADTLSVKMSMVDKGVKTHDPHSHFEDELFYMVEGEAIVRLNDEEQRLHPGDAFYAPATSWHNIRRTDMNQRIRYVMFKREFKGKLDKPFLPGKKDYKMVDCYVPYSKANPLWYLKKEMSGNGMTAERIKTSKKQQVKKATKQAVYFLLKGEARVSLNGEQCTVRPLTSVYVPKGATFSIRPNGKEALEYILVHTE